MGKGSGIGREGQVVVPLDLADDDQVAARLEELDAVIARAEAAIPGLQEAAYVLEKPWRVARNAHSKMQGELDQARRDREALVVARQRSESRYGQRGNKITLAGFLMELPDTRPEFAPIEARQLKLVNASGRDLYYASYIWQRGDHQSERGRPRHNLTLGDLAKLWTNGELVGLKVRYVETARRLLHRNCVSPADLWVELGDDGVPVPREGYGWDFTP